MPSETDFGDLIAGVLIVQRELVLMLEREGVLPRGEFQARLEEHLKRTPAEQRARVLYRPMAELAKALAAKRAKRASTH